MSVKQLTKLEYLTAWKKRPLVDKLIDNGLSGFYIQKWINENGLTISTPTVYKYMKLRQQAIKNNIPITQLVADRRRKRVGGNKKPKIVRDIEAGKDPLHKKQPFNNPTNDDRMRKNFSTDHVTNETEIIDLMLDKGYKQIREGKDLSTELTKQMIELINLKNKITHSNLTIYGQQERRLRIEAMENVVASILMDYVPEEKYQEVVDRINHEMKEVTKKIDKAQA